MKFFDRKTVARSMPPVVVVLLSALLVPSVSAAYAQGNLQLVFHTKSGKSTDGHPLTANLSNLWCQAAMTGRHGDIVRLPIERARFLHYDPDKAFEARVDENRAYLDLGHQNLFAAGKYKCEITTKQEEMVHGNMFVYMRPVFHTNASMRLEARPGAEGAFDFEAGTTRAVRGGTARLLCPARGYPRPEVRWFRGGRQLVPGDKYRLVRNELHVRAVADEDEGAYRCVATNEFPEFLDGPVRSFDAFLDHQLRVSGSLDWLVPLVVIVVILLLLFVTIYACAWWKRRAGRKSYDVARQEKGLYAQEEQRLKEEEEE